MFQSNFYPYFIITPISNTSTLPKAAVFSLAPMHLVDCMHELVLHLCNVNVFYWYVPGVRKLKLE